MMTLSLVVLVMTRLISSSKPALPNLGDNNGEKSVAMLRPLAGDCGSLIGH